MICAVEGCGRVVLARGFCSAHYQRFRYNGSLPLLHSPRTPDGYHAIHRQVRKLHGPARDHVCVDCGQPAVHWSWNRTGPSRTGIVSGITVTWGTNPADYSPRCQSDALRRDRSRRNEP